MMIELRRRRRQQADDAERVAAGFPTAAQVKANLDAYYLAQAVRSAPPKPSQAERQRRANVQAEIFMEGIAVVVMTLLGGMIYGVGGLIVAFMFALLMCAVARSMRAEKKLKDHGINPDQ